MSETNHSISTSISASSSASSAKGWIVAIVVLLALGGGVVGAVVLMGSSSDNNGPAKRNDSARVERGTLPISVTESGNIVSARQQVISNELRSPAIIDELAEEGNIEEGDLIIRFSSQKLKDDIEESRLELQNAQDEYDAGLSSLQITKLQRDNNIRKAQIAVQDAENDVRKYMGAEWVDAYFELIAEQAPTMAPASPTPVRPKTTSKPHAVKPAAGTRPPIAAMSIAPAPLAAEHKAAGEATVSATSVTPLTGEPEMTPKATTAPAGEADATPVTMPPPTPSGEALQKIFAKLNSLEGGEWAQKHSETVSSVELAEGALKLAKEKLDAKKKINKDPNLKQPYSVTEIRGDELAVEGKQVTLDKAKMGLSILTTYTHPRQCRDKLTAVTDAKLRLAEALVDQHNKVTLAKTKVAMRLARLRRHRERHEENEDDFKNKLVYIADSPGLVVYDTGYGGRRSSSNEVTVAVGEEIRPRQQLMIIPDMSTLQVETKVFEAAIENVKPGLKAIIRLDARKGVPLQGTVSEVAQLPDTQRWYSADVKHYPVIVQFDHDISELRLKPKMTAKVEIILAELKDVLIVPITAVFTDHDVTFCYRRRGREVKRVPVAIGRSNDKRVQILAGVEEGDEVLLAPPENIEYDEKLTPLKIPGLKTPTTKRAPASRPTRRPNGNRTGRRSRGGRRGGRGGRR